jgi:hypothetical protein
MQFRRNETGFPTLSRRLLHFTGKKYQWHLSWQKPIFSTINQGFLLYKSLNKPNKIWTWLSKLFIRVLMTNNKFWTDKTEYKIKGYINCKSVSVIYSIYKLQEMLCVIHFVRRTKWSRYIVPSYASKFIHDRDTVAAEHVYYTYCFWLFSYRHWKKNPQPWNIREGKGVILDKKI